MTADSLLDGAAIGRLIAILTLVVGLILLAAWLIRRLGLGMSVSRSGAKSRRLSILEIRPIDAQRRLVLVSRDDVQHLLLVGGGQDLVVETKIDPLPAEDPLDRVHFRDVVLENDPSGTRILHPGARIDIPGDEV
ncbi:MAG: FliO/MopB family protein [Rhodospirillaceae bacterium]|nr:FliO/MopB family protein [Rhodospirillaceae bacterium]